MVGTGKIAPARGLVIRGGNLVLPHGVVRGSVVIVDGIIAEVHEGDTPEDGRPSSVPDHFGTIDARGLLVMPGLIDLHCDAIERELEPRPNTLFPFDMAFSELEKRLASSGITTMFHSISFGEGVGIRDCRRSLELIRLIHARKGFPGMLEHKLHLRYEVLYHEGLEAVRQLVDAGVSDFLSFMDHTPGQGQYAAPGSYVDWVTQVWGIPASDADAFLADLRTRHDSWDVGSISALALLAAERGIRMASHDDDSIGKVAAMASLGVGASEFPVNLEAAKAATQRGLMVCVGAPNLVRGGSHAGNMSAMDAVTAGYAHVICSDYHPQAMLRAVFAVARELGDLPRAMAMVTANPARAAGMGEVVGTIAAGKRADLILVDAGQAAGLDGGDLEGAGFAGSLEGGRLEGHRLAGCSQVQPLVRAVVSKGWPVMTMAYGKAG